MKEKTGPNLGTILEGMGGIATIGVTVVLSPILRRWYSRWGATDEETRRRLPGDEEAPEPKSQVDMAITVRAAAPRVWPWFVQLGCGRGGWYSYDLLDNGGVPSANEIMPEYQSLNVGDMVSAMPNGKMGFPVAVIEPGRALSLAGTLNTRTGKPAQHGDPALDAYFSGDQTFVVEPVDDKTSRILFRMRMTWNGTRLNNLIYRGFVEPISFVMGRKMLWNIKRRVERQRTGRVGD